MSNSAISGLTIIDFPAGMIMPYAGTATPAGWLECNGAEVDIAQYPSLSAALGTTWNNAKNPLTGATYPNPAAGKFRLPDLRGSFLRGSSNGVNNAQGVATGLAEFQSHKTAKNGLANSSVTTTSTGDRNQFDRTSGTVSSDHSHGGTTAGVGNHSHEQYVTANPGAGQYNTRHDYNYDANNLGTYYQCETGLAGAHSHSFSTGGMSVNHTHTTSWDGTFSVSGTTAAQTISGDPETRPDAVGVRYLIKY